MHLFPKNGLVVLIVVLLLTGCGVSDTQKVPTRNTANLEEILKAITQFSVVGMVSQDNILIGSTFYKIDKHTKMLKANNQELTIEELKAGDLVHLEDEGFIQQSFPGQGLATSVVLQNDTESKKVSESIHVFFEHQKTGNILSTTIVDLTEKIITLHFYEWEIHGKKYEAEIDRATNKFSVKEIENEEALEQERRSREMAAAHPEGSTAGHITEIYDDGFRINMVDYTFAKDIQLSNDLGDKLNKDNFQVGSFVSVDYDKIDSKSTIGKGILSKLTLLTEEENLAVRDWIKSIIEGDLYQEPVIMQFYSDQFQTYYTIRVADLKDDTWDTFELKYDLKSRTHTVTRIKN